MSASLQRMTFNVGPVCTALISALLSLVRYRHNPTLPFAVGTSIKLLQHSDFQSMPRGTIICCL